MYIEWETKCEEGKLCIAADVNWFHLTVIVCVCFIGSWIIIIYVDQTTKAYLPLQLWDHNWFLISHELVATLGKIT